MYAGIADALASEELEQLRVRAAHVEALQDALRVVLAMVAREGGWRAPEDQATLRRAMAVLVESEATP